MAKWNQQQRNGSPRPGVAVANRLRRGIPLGPRPDLSALLRGHTFNLGRRPSAATRAKLSAAKKGRFLSLEHRAKLSAVRRGKHRSPETRAKMSAAHKGRHLTSEQLARLHLALYARPNRAESSLLALLNAAFPGEWRYVGDGSLIVNGKCPDFVNVNGRKAIVELYGDYWHRGENERDREACFAPFGYRTVVVWERELKQPAAIVEKIREAVYK